MATSSRSIIIYKPIFVIRKWFVDLQRNKTLIKVARTSSSLIIKNILYYNGILKLNSNVGFGLSLNKKSFKKLTERIL